jgi:hypothetical protein
MPKSSNSSASNPVKLYVDYGVLTFEASREDSLQLGWFNCAICFGPEKLLLQGTSCLPEMKQEELHKPGFCICSEDLLKAVHAPWSLVFQPWSWQTVLLLSNSPARLQVVSNI